MVTGYPTENKTKQKNPNKKAYSELELQKCISLFNDFDNEKKYTILSIPSASHLINVTNKRKITT